MGASAGGGVVDREGGGRVGGGREEVVFDRAREVPRNKYRGYLYETLVRIIEQ